MKKHYFYSPSASKRWMTCPGSLDAPPSPESSYSTEGTRAHEVAEVAVRTGELVADDPEQHAAISVYTDFINQLRADKKPHFELVEDLREHATIADLGGTTDYAAIYVEGGQVVLHFVDYKHGAGVGVLAVENYQLLTYAVIFASWFGATIDLYRMTIIQPRCREVEPIQTWEASPERIAKHEAEILTVKDQKHFKAGPHCQFCSLAGSCPTLREHSLVVAQGLFEQAEVYDLIELLELSDAIRASLNKIEGILIEKARLGYELPGYKVVDSVGHRKWAVPETKLVRRLAKLGISRKQLFTKSMITPAAVERLLELPAKEKETALSGLTIREKIGQRVVPESARGEQLLLSVDQVFKGTNDEQYECV